jgi:hypothetical protein
VDRRVNGFAFAGVAILASVLGACGSSSPSSSSSAAAPTRGFDATTSTVAGSGPMVSERTGSVECTIGGNSIVTWNPQPKSGLGGGSPSTTSANVPTYWQSPDRAQEIAGPTYPSATTGNHEVSTPPGVAAGWKYHANFGGVIWGSKPCRAATSSSTTTSSSSP